jgi:hypothetical protein
MPRFADGAAFIVLDDSASPLLIATSYGVTTERLTRQSFEWLHEYAVGMHQRGSRYVVIVDARAAGRPPASVRTLVSKLTDELRQAAPGVELASLFVAENALLRGALTAIIWVSRSSWKPIVVSSWEEALRRGCEILRNAGIDVPSVPVRYRPPA